MKITGITKMAVLFVFGMNLIASPLQAFDSSEGGFNIWMPGKPTLQQVHHKSFIGDVKENTYTLKTKTEEFDVSYTDLPGIATVFESAKALFTKAKEGLLKDVGGEEIRFEKITFEGKEARELTFQIPSKGNPGLAVGKARFYLVGKRLFVVVASTTKGAKGNALLDRYLNSFQLLPQKK